MAHGNSSDFKAYRLYRDGQLIYEGRTSNFVDTGLANDATYTYVVKAVDYAGNESEPSNSWQVIPGLYGTATLDGVGGMTADGVETGILLGTVTLTATGDLTADGTEIVLYHDGNPFPLLGVGSMTVSGLHIGPQTGAATLAGVGSLSSSGVEVGADDGAATLAGTGAMSASGDEVGDGSAALAGTGAFGAIGEEVVVGAYRTYRSEDLVGATNITSWLDSGGQGMDLTATVSPTREASAYNALDGADFTGGQELRRLSQGDMSAPSQFTFYAVVTPDDTGGEPDNIALWGDDASALILGIDADMKPYFAQGGTALATYSTALTAGEKYVLSWSWDGDTAATIGVGQTHESFAIGNTELGGLTASSNMATYSTYVPANAVDDNSGTKWWSNGGPQVGSWFKVDVGSEKTLTRARMYQNGNDRLVNGKLQYSTDDTNWTDVPGGTIPNTTDWDVTFSESVTARYLRAYSNGSQGTWWQIFEFDVFATVAPTFSTTDKFRVGNGNFQNYSGTMGHLQWSATYENETDKNAVIASLETTYLSSSNSNATFVGASRTGVKNGAARTYTVPGGIQEGDLLVLYVITRNAIPTDQSPTGWTQHLREVHGQSGDNNEYTCVYTKVSDGTETTVSHTVSDAGTDGVQAVVMAFRNVALDTVPTYNETLTTDTSSLSAAGISVALCGSALIDPGESIDSVPSGYTEAARYNDDPQTESNGVSIAAAYKAHAAGTVSAATFGTTGAIDFDNSVILTLRGVSTYEVEVLADAPVQYLRLSETAGTTAVSTALVTYTYSGTPGGFDGVFNTLKGTTSASATDLGAHTNINDGNTGTSWLANGNDNWAKVDLGEGNSAAVDSYDLTSHHNDANHLIYNWKLQGSNDDTNWDDLDTHVNDGSYTAASQSLNWSVGSTTHYRYFRMLQTGLSKSSSAVFQFSDFELFGEAKYGGVIGAGAEIGVSGVAGGGVHFRDSGTTDVITTSVAGVSGAGARTVEAWLRWDVVFSVGTNYYFAYGTNASTQRFAIRLNDVGGSGTVGGVRVEVDGGSFIGDTAIDDGDWHHVVVVVPDGASTTTDVKVYLDGVLETGSINSAAINTGTTNAIEWGNRTWGTGIGGWEGWADELAFYDKALSAARILAHYNAMVGLYKYSGTPGGRDGMLNTFQLPAGAFSASSIDLSNDPEHAVDGSTSSYYLSSIEAGAWWKVDLGSQRAATVTSYDIEHRNSGDHFLRNWKLQGSSDDENWLDVMTHTSDTTIAAADTAYHWQGSDGLRQGNPRYRFLRLLLTGNDSSGDTHLQFGELDFFGQVETTPETFTYGGTYNARDGVIHDANIGGTTPNVLTYSASSTIDVRTAEKVADNSLDGNSNCLHTTNTANSWWKVDFGAGNTFKATHYAIEGRSSGGLHPRNWELQGSNDDTNWDVLRTHTSDTSVGDGTGAAWTIAPAEYRYYRIYQTGLNSGSNNYLTIGELEFWGEYTGYNPKAPPYTTNDYDDAVLADSPQVYLPLHNADSSAWVDLSGNGRDPVLVGSPTASGTGPQAMTDSVLFDASGDQFYWEPASWFNTNWSTNGFTHECWFRADAGPAKIHLFTIDPGSGNRTMQAGIENGGKVTYWLAQDGPLRQSAATYNDDVWHHLAVTWTTGGTLTYYVDGAQTDQWTGLGTLNTHSIRLTINRLSGGGEGTSGWEMRGWAVWDSVLTAEQIATHYMAALMDNGGLHWYRPEDIVGTPGSTITSWTNTGTTPSADLTSVSGTPTITASLLNGHDGVRFDGAEYIDAAGAPAEISDHDSFTVFGLVGNSAQNAEGNPGSLLGLGQTGANGSRVVGLDSNHTLVVMKASNANKMNSTSTVPTTGFTYFVGRYDHGTKVTTWNVLGGADEASAANGPASWDNSPADVRMGRRGTSGDLRADIVEVGYINRIVTAAELAAIEAYLAAKSAL